MSGLSSLGESGGWSGFPVNRTNFSTAVTLADVADQVRDECGYLRSLRFTREYREWIWITRISFPMLLVIGTFGNVMAVVSVCGDRRGPKRTFLLGMFLANLWFLWNRLIIALGSKIWDNGTDSLKTDLYGHFYKITAGVWLYLESVLFFSSQWILMAFCIDRFLAIRFPLHHRTNLRRNSLFAISFIFACSSVNALYIPVVYYWILQNSMLESGAIIPQFPVIFRHWRRIEMWWEVLIRLLAYGGTATLNMIIMSRLQQPHMQSSHGCTKVPKKASTMIQQHDAVRRTNSSHSANRILIASSFFFLATQSLDFGMSLLLAFSQAPICLFHITNGFLQVYDPFRYCLVNIYFAFGFIFYLCCGENSCRRVFLSSRKRRLSVVDSLPLTEVSGSPPTRFGRAELSLRQRLSIVS